MTRQEKKGARLAIALMKSLDNLQKFEDQRLVLDFAHTFLALSPETARIQELKNKIHALEKTL